jgi:hypothetical protein
MVQDIRSYVASTIRIKDVIDRVKVGLQLVMPDAKVSACEIRDVTHDLGRLRTAEAFENEILRLNGGPSDVDKDGCSSFPLPTWSQHLRECDSSCVSLLLFKFVAVLPRG